MSEGDTKFTRSFREYAPDIIPSIFQVIEVISCTRPWVAWESASRASAEAADLSGTGSLNSFEGYGRQVPNHQ